MENSEKILSSIVEEEECESPAVSVATGEIAVNCAFQDFNDSPTHDDKKALPHTVYCDHPAKRCIPLLTDM